MLLKLEKGFNFGDATIDDSFTKDYNSSSSPSYSISWFNEIKEKAKKVAVVAPKSILDCYKQYEGKDQDQLIQLLESSNSKEAVKTACGACLEHAMTLCHVSLESLSIDKNLNKLKKWTNKMWSSTPINGLFVTIWTGSPTQRAFVGIALNKAEIE